MSGPATPPPSSPRSFGGNSSSASAGSGGLSGTGSASGSIGSSGPSSGRGILASDLVSRTSSAGQGAIRELGNVLILFGTRVGYQFDAVPMESMLFARERAADALAIQVESLIQNLVTKATQEPRPRELEAIKNALDRLGLNQSHFRPTDTTSTRQPNLDIQAKILTFIKCLNISADGTIRFDNAAIREWEASQQRNPTHLPTAANSGPQTANVRLNMNETVSRTVGTPVSSYLQSIVSQGGEEGAAAEEILNQWRGATARHDRVQIADMNVALVVSSIFKQIFPSSRSSHTPPLPMHSAPPSGAPSPQGTARHHPASSTFSPNYDAGPPSFSSSGSSGSSSPSGNDLSSSSAVPSDLLSVTDSIAVEPDSDVETESPLSGTPPARGGGHIREPYRPASHRGYVSHDDQPFSGEDRESLFSQRDRSDEEESDWDVQSVVSESSDTVPPENKNDDYLIPTQFRQQTTVSSNNQISRASASREPVGHRPPPHSKGFWGTTVLKARAAARWFGDLFSSKKGERERLVQQGSGQSSSRETPLSSARVLSSRRSNDALFSRGSSEDGLDVSGSDEATWRDVSEAEDDPADEAELFELSPHASTQSPLISRNPSKGQSSSGANRLGATGSVLSQNDATKPSDKLPSLPSVGRPPVELPPIRRRDPSRKSQAIVSGAATNVTSSLSTASKQSQLTPSISQLGGSKGGLSTSSPEKVTKKKESGSDKAVHFATNDTNPNQPSARSRANNNSFRVLDDDDESFESADEYPITLISPLHQRLGGEPVVMKSTTLTHVPQQGAEGVKQTVVEQPNRQPEAAVTTTTTSQQSQQPDAVRKQLKPSNVQPTRVPLSSTSPNPGATWNLGEGLVIRGLGSWPEASTNANLDPTAVPPLPLVGGHPPAKPQQRLNPAVGQQDREGGTAPSLVSSSGHLSPEDWVANTKTLSGAPRKKALASATAAQTAAWNRSLSQQSTMGSQAQSDRASSRSPTSPINSPVHQPVPHGPAPLTNNNPSEPLSSSSSSQPSNTHATVITDVIGAPPPPPQGWKDKAGRILPGQEPGPHDMAPTARINPSNLPLGSLSNPLGNSPSIGKSSQPAADKPIILVPGSSPSLPNVPMQPRVTSSAKPLPPTTLSSAQQQASTSQISSSSSVPVEQKAPEEKPSSSNAAVVKRAVRANPVRPPTKKDSSDLPKNMDY